MDLNKVMLIGNIVTDVQSRMTPSGQSVVSFRLATNRKYKDRTGEIKEDAQFHNISAWGKLGEILAQYMSKGRKIYIEGRLQTRSWDDPQSGQKKFFTEIVAENAIMLDKKDLSSSPSSSYNNQANTPAAPTVNNQANVNIPAPEQIPTINIDENQEEIKMEDIPF